MLRPDPRHSERLGDLLQSPPEGLYGSHDVLDVVYAGEPDEQQPEEFGFGRGERFGRQDLEEVAKVVPSGLSALNPIPKMLGSGDCKSCCQDEDEGRARCARLVGTHE